MARAVLVLWSLLVAHSVGCRFDTSGLGSPDGARPDLASSETSLLFPDAPPPDRGYDIPFIPLPDQGGDLGCPTLFRCSGTKSQICSGGKYVDRECAKGCQPETGTCISFPASHEAPALMHHGVAKLEIPDGGALMVDTDACKLTAQGFPLPAGILMAAPSARCVMAVNELTVHPMAKLLAAGKRPLLIAASGAVRVKGLIDVGGKGNQPGPGGGVGGKPGVKPVNSSSPTPLDGEGSGCGGGAPGYLEAEGIAGGAGGSNGGAGGSGGGIGNSAGPNARQPSGCDPSSCAGILSTGSGGGAGAGGLFGGAGAGGGGGGGLQISSLRLISIEPAGAVNAGGGGGRGGGIAGASGGGGGSGGGVLLESWEVTVAGLVAANGGGGGGGSVPGRDGHHGADALASTAAAAGGASVTVDNKLIPDWVSGSGGAGSGATTDGLAGGRSASLFELAGGGGGGAGRICVRVASENLAAAKKGKFSPAFVESAQRPTLIEPF